MSKRREHLTAYVEGWRSMNVERVLSALAEGFVFDDPARSEPVTKATMSDYMASWEKRTTASSGPWRYEDSHQVVEDRDGVLLRWKWWHIAGSDIQGSALTKTSDEGMLFERIAYYPRTPSLAAQNTVGLVTREAEMAWQGWSAGSEQTEEPRYKTFFGDGGQPTGGLVQGILEYPPGTRSRAHWHTPAETYYVLAGTGVGRIGDASLPIGPGDAVFVPGGAVHAFENGGYEALRVLWTLNCDRVDEIDFHYLD